jgi:hypothetical protein
MSRIFDTPLRVELRVQPIEPLSLEELKAAADAAIAEDPESFEELSGKTVQWWNATLSTAETPQEVVNAFSTRTGDS